MKEKIFRGIFNIAFVIIFVLISCFLSEINIVSVKAGNKQLLSGSENATSTDADKENADAVTLYIDSQNKYQGMTFSYENGYMPVVNNNQVEVIYPIIADGNIKGDFLQAGLNLGDTQTAPFVFKNYEKNIKLQTVRVNDDTQEVQAYVAAFTIDLKEKRINGSYPVVLSVKGRDASNNEINQVFTTYVTITDGIDNDEEQQTDVQTEEQPVFVPKMIVESYTFSKKQIYPGDTVTAKIVLKNTSKENVVKNMTVSVSSKNEAFVLLNKSDSVYVDLINAQDTYTVSFDYQIGAEVSSGQYDLDLAMDYADDKGNTYTAGGRAKLDVSQEAKVQFDPLLIADEAVVADVIEAKIQAMNLGRSNVYNVRAVLSGDGLTPDGTIFIGEMEPGSVMSAATQVSISSLQGDDMYGMTEGLITYYYEDGDGKEYTEEASFNVLIKSPFSEQQPKEDNVNQWWTIMAVIGICILVFLIMLIARKIKGRRNAC